MKYFQGFALAFNMMSIISFFKIHTFFKGINGYSAMFYPLVGLLLGLFLWFTHSLLKEFIPPIHLSVIIFSLWVLLTGAIHLDGFSDTVDGLFVNKEKTLEVMKDSYVGGMGMIFSFVFLALKLSSIIAFNAFYLLPVILMFSRLNATLAIYFFDYISDGVGKLLKEELKLRHLLFAVFYSLFFAYLFSFSIAFVISLFILLSLAKFFISRMKGFNGDMYGFSIELTELALLNFIILQQI